MLQISFLIGQVGAGIWLKLVLTGIFNNTWLVRFRFRLNLVVVTVFFCVQIFLPQSERKLFLRGRTFRLSSLIQMRLCHWWLQCRGDRNWRWKRCHFFMTLLACVSGVFCVSKSFLNQVLTFVHTGVVG